MPAHADDVIILLGRIDDIDLAVVDLFFEFLKKRRAGESSRENPL